MKYQAYLLIVISFLLWQDVKSQSKEIDIKDLQTPNSPGFVLADKSPSSVEKPTNPRAFGISIFNLREGGAVEVTPFWLFQQPRYTQEKFIKPIPFLSTFNVSSATFKTDSSSALSIGFKAHVIRIFSKETKSELQDLDTSGSTIAAVSLLDSFQVLQLDGKMLRWLGGEKYKSLNQKEKDRVVLKAIDSLKKRINGARTKPVFQTEFAGAYLGESKNNSFKKLSATKAGIWLNFHFKPQKFPFDLLILSKYSWTVGVSPKDSTFLDFGVGVSYEKSKFDLHLEYVNRKDLSFNQNYNRLVFVANYQIFDEITLVASFGKNFNTVNNIFTVLGTRIGISKTKIKLKED